MELNANQELVLRTLKENHAWYELTAFNAVNHFVYDGAHVDVYRAWEKLSDLQEAEVLVEFAKWVIDQGVQE